jgi:ribosomal protein L9
LQKLSKTIYAPVEQQEEKSTEASMRKALKKTLSRKPAIIPNATRDYEHIFGTIKDNGVTITLI